FFAYGASYTGGVYVAGGDVSGDGLADIITGTDASFPGQVKVFSGATGSELASFFPYGAGFIGGVRVAAGDVNDDSRADIITGTGPGAAQVKAFDGATMAEIRSFFAYSGYTGGVFVAGDNALARDFGDAPISYHTLLADNGPQHRLGSGLKLGAIIDAEED